MTHEELLERLSFGRIILKDEVVAQLKALRAVVELHKPSPIGRQECWHCEGWYPCPTIQAIEKELK